MPDRITCVVADDHPAIVDSVSRVLDHQGIDVVGNALDGIEALERIRALRPQVALVDIELPGMSGLDVAREVARTAGETRIVLFTGAGEVALLQEALDTGAHGFVVKTAPLEEVARAIKTVADGGRYVDSVVAGELARHGLPELTARERDVLRLLSDGLDYAQVGEKLFLSPETVRVHVRKAMTKLEASTRTQAVAEALRRRLIP